MKLVPTFEQFEMQSNETLPGSRIHIKDSDELKCWLNLSLDEKEILKDGEQTKMPQGEYEVSTLNSDYINFEDGMENKYRVKRGDYEKIKKKIILT